MRWYTQAFSVLYAWTTQKSSIHEILKIDLEEKYYLEPYTFSEYYTWIKMADESSHLTSN